MRRQALLIGYTGRESKIDSTLNGVSADLNHYKKYLMSLKGGVWLESEIIILEDTDLITLNNILERIKEAENDVVFTVFSGHGEYNRETGRRMICISDHEEVPEDYIADLAPKQIMILDSCSGYREEPERKIILDEAANEAIEERKLSPLEQRARDLYDKWCISCPIQDLRFYAAEKGTYANDDEQGGVYSSILLNVLNTVEEDLNIDMAHNIANDIIRQKTRQKPDKFVPRVRKFLPGAIDVLR